MKRSRLWFLYPVTGLFMIAFSLWMGTWYAAVSLLLTVAMGIMLLDNRFSKKRDRLLAPAIKLIHSLESDDETRSCFEEGKAYYLAMERRSIIDTILGLLFIWASVLWAYERLLRPDGGAGVGAGIAAPINPGYQARQRIGGLSAGRNLRSFHYAEAYSVHAQCSRGPVSERPQ